MVALKSFSVWISCSAKGASYVLSTQPPCNLPKSGFIHLQVQVDSTGQHLGEINGKYFYGPEQEDVISVSYSQYDLQRVEQGLLGEGNLVEKITNYIAYLSPDEKVARLETSPFTCNGDLVSSLAQLFLFQLGVVLLFIAWLNTPCFWEKRLLPLYIRLPTPDSIITRRLLKLVTIYLVYLFTIDSCFQHDPIIVTILNLVNNWNDVFVLGDDLDGDFFHAQLNLGLFKFVLLQVTFPWKDESSLLTKEEYIEKKEVVPLRYHSSSSSADDSSSEEEELSPPEKAPLVITETSSLSSTEPVRLIQLTEPTLVYLESKKKELEKSSSLINRSLANHFTVLSHEVITYAMNEVQRRLEGCVQDHIYQSYPRIDSYIAKAFDNKSNYLVLLKQQLEAEVYRARDICQQAFLVLETAPYYEERISHLEKEVAALRADKINNHDLHRKVEHLQSTVTQLLKAVRCRY